MKKRFSEEQIVQILGEAESGAAINELCRGMSASDVRACTYNSAQPNSNSSDCMADGENPFIIDPENGDNVPVELQEFNVE